MLSPLSCDRTLCPMTVLWPNIMPHGCVVTEHFVTWLCCGWTYFVPWLCYGWILCPMSVLSPNIRPHGCVVTEHYVPWLCCGWTLCPMTVLWLNIMPHDCVVTEHYVPWVMTVLWLEVVLIVTEGRDFQNHLQVCHGISSLNNNEELIFQIIVCHMVSLH